MFSFLNLSFWTILRVFFSIIFTLSALYIYKFILEISENTECKLSDGWRVSNSKTLALLLIIIGVINIIIPASKFIAGLPIIGSLYVFLFVLGLFMLLFLINRICINIMENDENQDCYIEKYDTLITWFSNRNIMDNIYITIMLSIIFFYL